MTSSDDTFKFTCPACLETSVLPREHEDQIMPCPSCGVSAAITDDEKIPPPPKASEPLTPTRLELAYMTQLRSAKQNEQTPDFKRVAYRVFRLQSFETWEPLFDRVAEFASSLPPGALINISQSGGQNIGSHAAAVWYWEHIPMDKARIRAFQDMDATNNVPQT